MTTTQNTPEIARAPSDLDYEESTVGELRRIGLVGTVWFTAAVIAVGIPLDGLLTSGWRPVDLPIVAEVAWWVGAALTSLGVFGFAWAGCPVWGWGPEASARQKSVAIRAGVVLFLAGIIISSVAVMSVPAVAH